MAPMGDVPGLPHMRVGERRPEPMAPNAAGPHVPKMPQTGVLENHQPPLPGQPRRP